MRLFSLIIEHVIPRDKIVPLVVALPLFLQNLDTSIMGTALPTIANALHVDALSLNLAITAYLISLAIFLPASGWVADRFGSRRVFCGAVGLFAFASALCGLSTSLEMLVACRALQGIGGAMMVPVGRLILLRSVTPGAMVAAMVWFTVPPAFARLLGPFVGGVMVTWVSWRWIFLINVPIGLLGIALALSLLEPGEPADAPRAFDAIGFVLLGVGLACVLSALQRGGTAGTLISPFLLAAIGAVFLVGYWLHSRRAKAPLIDLKLMDYQTFRLSMWGGIPLRLAIGAVPFLLPLLLQMGFGLSPLDSGLLTMGTAIGSLATRVALGRAVNAVGFKPLLQGATIASCICYFIYGMFRETTPHPLLFLAMVAGGLVISMVMVCLQTLAFTELPSPLMGQATALSTMAQQLSISLGVLYGTELLRLSVWWRDGDPTHLYTSDFSMAFLVVSATVLFALPILRRLPKDVGAELRGR